MGLEIDSKFSLGKKKKRKKVYRYSEMKPGGWGWGEVVAVGEGHRGRLTSTQARIIIGFFCLFVSLN